MSVDTALDACLANTKTVVRQRGRRERAEIYASGIQAKLGQADFALRRLRELKDRSDTGGPFIARGDPTIADQVAFYCDAFWAFLYSSLDVVAQFVNQAVDLGKNEKDVNFKQVDRQLSGSASGTTLQKRVSRCRRSRAFRNLDKYRNCSTHRRQVYVKTVVVSQTPGYPGGGSATGPIPSVQRVLCDDPLELRPTVKKERQIPQYMQETRCQIAEHIKLILKSVEPVA